jgi:hypothetical protein
MTGEWSLRPDPETEAAPGEVTEAWDDGEAHEAGAETEVDVPAASDPPEAAPAPGKQRLSARERRKAVAAAELAAMRHRGPALERQAPDAPAGESATAGPATEVTTPEPIEAAAEAPEAEASPVETPAEVPAEVAPEQAPEPAAAATSADVVPESRGRGVAFILAGLVLLVLSALVGFFLVQQLNDSNAAGRPGTTGGIATDATTPPSSRAPARRAAQPAFVMEPASIAFGTQPVGTITPQRELSIRNRSGRTGQITAISVEGNTSDFLVSDRCAGAEVASGARCRITAQFRPGTPGVKRVTVRISLDSATPRQVTARLTGTGG